MKSFTLTRAALLATALAIPGAAFAQAVAQIPAGTAATPAPVAAGTAATPAAPATQPADNAAAATAKDRAAKHEARVERRIDELHEKLHITPAQEPAFNRFATVMRGNAEAMEQAFRQHTGKLDQMSAVDLLQSRAQRAGAHAENEQKLSAAFQSLYDGLSPDQKRAADQLFRSYAEHAPGRGGPHRG